MGENIFTRHCYKFPGQESLPDVLHEVAHRMQNDLAGHGFYEVKIRCTFPDGAAPRIGYQAGTIAVEFLARKLQAR